MANEAFREYEHDKYVTPPLDYDAELFNKKSDDQQYMMIEKIKIALITVVSVALLILTVTN